MKAHNLRQGKDLARERNHYIQAAARQIQTLERMESGELQQFLNIQEHIIDENYLYNLSHREQNLS